MNGPRTRIFAFFLITSLLTLTTPLAQADWDSVLRLYDQKNMYPKDDAKGNSPAYFKWTKCMTEDTNHQPVAWNKNGQLLEDCQPDTLYSWGGSNKKSEFRKNASGEKWANKFTKAIYAHINPLATFGYGGLVFRMKLKPGTKFLLYYKDAIPLAQFCPKLLKPEQWQNTVIVRYWIIGGRTGVDYILCSPGPIHSWSINTKKLYDEVATSLIWNNNQNDEHGFIPYTRNYGHAELFDSGLDSQDWSSDRLYGNLVTMRDYIKKGKGELYFNPSVTPDEAFHNSTAKPIYWNTKRYVAPPAPTKTAEPAAAKPVAPAAEKAPAAPDSPANREQEEIEAKAG